VLQLGSFWGIQLFCPDLVLLPRILEALVGRRKVNAGDTCTVRLVGCVGVVLTLEAIEKLCQHHELLALAAVGGAELVNEACFPLVDIAVGVYDAAIDRLAREWADRATIPETLDIEGHWVEDKGEAI